MVNVIGSGDRNETYSILLDSLGHVAMVTTSRLSQRSREAGIERAYRLLTAARFTMLAAVTMGLLSICCSAIATAEDIAGVPACGDSTRPRIGLVLAGGGARGGAHIGVLRVLEENRVPIDCISGTSIGAIVGGLYAMGRTPDQIEQIVDDIDWADVFKDKIDRQYRKFRRKRDDDLALFHAKPGFNDGKFELPTGIIQGQKIDLLLSRLTLPAATIKDFDNLGVPFRAVATNIATGKAVVFDSGNLAQVIRASMSIPTILAPIRIDGRMLVDGGVSNNLPVDVIREMGASIVIAVDISTPLATEEELDSVVAITAQLTGILTRRGTVQQIATLTDKDLLIVPDLSDVTTGDFDHITEAVPAGTAEANKYVSRFRAWSLSPDAYAKHLAARTPMPGDLPLIEFVDVENDSGLADNAIFARVNRTEVDAPLDIDRVEKNINLIYGTELFQNIRYEVIEKDGETGIQFELDARKWGPNYVQFGMAMSGDFEGGGSTAVNAAYQLTEMNSLGGELRVGGGFGDDGGLMGEFYQPLNAAGAWFVMPLVGYGWRNVDVFESGHIISEQRVKEWGGSLAVGREFGNWGEVRLGLRRLVGQADERVGINTPNVDSDVGESYLRLSADTLDNAAFPQNGFNVLSEYSVSRDSLGADADFEQLIVAAAGFRTWGKNTFGLSAKYAGTIDGDASIGDIFRAGGLFNLSGFQFNELSGQYAAQLTGHMFREIVEIKLLSVFAGVSLEYGNVFQNSDEIDFDSGLLAGSLWLGLDTPVGPVYLGSGWAEGGNSALYLNFGRPLTVNARRGFLRR